MVGVLSEKEVVRRNDLTVKIDAEVVRKAKIVAAYKEVPLAEYVSDLLRAMVDKDLEQEQDKERKSRGHSKGKN